MLLIFFLVTSSMDTDKGMLRQLPPVQDENTVLDVKRDDVITLKLDSHDRLTCNDEEVTLPELTERISRFADEGRLTHIVSIQTSRQATYDAYYQMQNAIVAAYNQLRNRRARQQYGQPYAKCTAAQKNTVAGYYPMRVSETMTDIGF
jgi:biopolymer transport protein ExbD